MELIDEINIMANKKMVILLNVVWILLLVPFLYFFSFLAIVLVGDTDTFLYSSEDVFFGLATLIVLLVIHELIHGVFFKVFRPENPVKFGIKWKSFMAYATSPGSLYNRNQMLVIGLAPFVLLSVALTGLTVAGYLSPGWYVLLASAHAAGCVGDFYYVYLLLWKYRKEAILVEDTEQGLLIYQAERGA